MISPYRFRPFVRADLPMAAQWLRTSEVARWWGDPDEQLTLVSQDIDEPLMRQWVVEHDSRPFAYVQAYAASAWPQPHLISLPPASYMIDVFVGEPDMLGRGHGSAFLRQFCRSLFAAGATCVATDPDVTNHRARRAYDRAGFVRDRLCHTPAGTVALIVFQDVGRSKVGESLVPGKNSSRGGTPVISRAPRP